LAGLNPANNDQKVGIEIVRTSAIDEDGDLRVREHFDRLAAEDNRRDAATPVRGHQDQIAPSRRGGIDNCLIHVFVLDAEHLAADTG
jgi:hypothetical protein